MTANPRSLFLVIDNDLAPWEPAKASLKNSAYEMHCVSEEDTAVEFLQSSPDGIACVILNPNISRPAGVPVIRHIYEVRPTVPIYLAPQEEFTAPEKVLDRLGVRKILDRSRLAEEAADILKSFQFNPDEAIRSGKELSKERVGEEASGLSDEQFHPIRAADFLSGSKSVFDVYVRLPTGRFVKILQSGDNFSRDRLMAYLNKGVTHFYILKELQKSYLSYCDEMAKRLIGNFNVDNSIKIRQVANLGQETANFLKMNGVTPGSIEFARNYAVTVEKLVDRLGAGKNRYILEFMKDMLTYEHSVGVVMVGSMLLEPLGFERQKSAETIGLACLLHDIGLQTMPDEVKSEDPANMTEEQIKIFQTHPIVGSEMLRELKGVDEGIAGAVLQHHERRSGNGFPFQRKTGTVQRIAEVIGIADEFLLLMRQAEKDPELNFARELESRIFNGFSLPVVDAFQKTVMPTYTRGR